MPPKRVTQHGAQSQTTSLPKTIRPKRKIPQQHVDGPVIKMPKNTVTLAVSPSVNIGIKKKKGELKNLNLAIPSMKNTVHLESQLSSSEMLSDDFIVEDNDNDREDLDLIQKSVVNVEPSQVKCNYNSMTKSMQVFKGSSEDHFETWEENTRLYLDKQCPNSSEDQKMTAVKLKIQGYPRMILKQHPNITTLDGIFDALRPTYGADEITMLNEIKQTSDESVRVYFSRLKTNLHLLGYVDSSKGNRIFLNQFLNGLLPSIRAPVKALKPQKLLDAVAIAQEVESDRVSDESRKKKCETFNAMKHEEEISTSVLTQMEEKINALERQLADSKQQQRQYNDRLNAVNGKYGRISEQFDKLNVLPSSQSSSDYRNRSYNRSAFTQIGQQTSNYQSRCFGCNQAGHSYQRCRLLSTSQRDRLRGELRDFYQAAKQTNSPANIANFKPSFSLNSSGTVASPQAPFRH